MFWMSSLTTFPRRIVVLYLVLRWLTSELKQAYSPVTVQYISIHIQNNKVLRSTFVWSVQNSKQLATKVEKYWSLYILRFSRFKKSEIYLYQYWNVAPDKPLVGTGTSKLQDVALLPLGFFTELMNRWKSWQESQDESGQQSTHCKNSVSKIRNKYSQKYLSKKCSNFVSELFITNCFCLDRWHMPMNRYQ